MENQEIDNSLESMVTATEVENAELNAVADAQMSSEAIDAVQSTTTDGENRINDTTEVKVDSNIENAKWYVLHTFSGYENVANNLNRVNVFDKDPLANIQSNVNDVYRRAEDDFATEADDDFLN